MGWIKRNLFFLISAIVSVGMLGMSGFFIYTSWTANAEASEKLNQNYNALKELQQQNPAPGNDKIDNTKIANDQEKLVSEWIASAGKHFQPIPAIPTERPVTSETFAAALRRTVDQLQHEADDSGVALPPKYDFSFSAQRPLMKFAPGSLDPLAVQLGEVKVITETLFSARINSLDSIQRIRVSGDDASGPQGDYFDRQSVSNNLAVITPYMITFRCFAPELARVLSGLAKSSNAFIVRSIIVQPASAAGAVGGSAPSGAMGGIPGGAATTPTATGKGGLQTILKEQLLHVTMQIELVKLLPKS
jgi:hypothetical protein